MNTLEQIEQLLLPIWNKLYTEDRDNIPKSFNGLMANIIPKYKNDSFNGILN